MACGAAPDFSFSVLLNELDSDMAVSRLEKRQAAIEHGMPEMKKEHRRSLKELDNATNDIY